MADSWPVKRDVSESEPKTRLTNLSSQRDEQVALSLQSCKRYLEGVWPEKENTVPMGDRRRHQRFVMSDTCEGTFQLLEDVSVEEVSDDELRLLSAAPARPGEIVSVEVPGESGNGNAVFKGRVAESRPVMTEGTLRHRIVVKVAAEGQQPSPPADELVKDGEP